MASIVTATEVLNDHWEKVDPSTPRDQVSKSVYVLHRFQYSKSLLNKSKPTTLDYTIVSGDKQLVLPTAYYKELQAQYPGINAAKAFDMLSKNFAPDTKKMRVSMPKSFALRGLMGVLAVIALIAVPLTYVYFTSEKNFTGKVVTYANSKSEAKVGDFVETKLMVIDAYGIEITTTHTNYGIETGKTKSTGNTYVLAVSALDERETYLFRYDPASDIGKQVEKFLKESDTVEFGKVQGELRPISDVEHLDQTEQVVDYFKGSIADLNTKNNLSFSEPKFLIDGRVTMGNMTTVIMFTVAVAVLAIVLIVATVLLHKSYKGAIYRYIAGLTKTTI